MQCDNCKIRLDPGATFCSRCGRRLLVVVDEETSKTTAFTARSDSAPLQLDDDSTPERSNRAKWLIVAAGVLLTGIVTLVAVLLTRGDSTPTPAAQQAASSPPPSNGGVEPANETWWTPPSAKRVSVEALAYAFATVDETKLGAVYDKDLKPVYGAPHLYEDHEPRRNRRDEMSKSLVTLRNTLQMSAGFNFLFLRFGTTYSSEHIYQLYRAFQVDEVVSVDEDKRMREPPAEAVFYLAEVHLGASYDMLVEGDFEDMGQGLEVILQEGSWSAESLQGSRHVKISQSGLGLVPRTGEAIFAMTPAEVRKHYETTGHPVPIKLVFKTIPGRGLKEKKLASPKVIIDEKTVLAEGEVRRWDLEKGKYRISAKSKPNGLKLVVAGDASCSPSIPVAAEQAEVRTVCEVGSYADLQITNYTGFGMGPSENLTVFVAKLSD